MAINWGRVFTTAALVCSFALSVQAQEPVIVQPGAPGQPTRALPSSTRAQLPPQSHKDIEFMQGMIMHHAQAVEMTALIETRTSNKNIHLLGARISKSQADEMNFMRRWLELRGERTDMPAHAADHSSDQPSKPSTSEHKHGAKATHLMPGMLTAEQMDALKKAKGAEFDRLFLKGMIQHHNGALVMVKDLFDAAGSGQDAELFNFATDVDSGQRAEIKSMQTLLGERP